MLLLRAAFVRCFLVLAFVWAWWVCFGVWSLLRSVVSRGVLRSCVVVLRGGIGVVW